MSGDDAIAPAANPDPVRELLRLARSEFRRVSGPDSNRESIKIGPPARLQPAGEPILKFSLFFCPIIQNSPAGPDFSGTCRFRRRGRSSGSPGPFLNNNSFGQDTDTDTDTDTAMLMPSRLESGRNPARKPDFLLGGTIVLGHSTRCSVRPGRWRAPNPQKKRMATACTIELRSTHVLAGFMGKHKRTRGYRK